MYGVVVLGFGRPMKHRGVQTYWAQYIQYGIFTKYVYSSLSIKMFTSHA